MFFFRTCRGATLLGPPAQPHRGSAPPAHPLPEIKPHKLASPCPFGLPPPPGGHDLNILSRLPGLLPPIPGPRGEARGEQQGCCWSAWKVPLSWKPLSRRVIPSVIISFVKRGKGGGGGKLFYYNLIIPTENASVELNRRVG